MSEQLSAAAQKLGVPETLIERSARARAAATGQSYEEVIAAWAGGEAVASAAPTEEPPPQPATAEPAPEPAETTPSPAQPEPARVPAAAAVSAAPVPERVTPDEALEYPVVVTVATAGITERTASSIPSWLGAILLIVPAFGLLYLALGASAECGTGTELRVDRITGLVENCDGTPFEGRGAGGGGGDFIAAGQEVFADCAACHGPQGQGAGAFPALTGVLTTFGSCADHIEWVSLGSAGFVAAGRNTYGDTAQAVDPPGMPSFGGSLSEEQLASVVAFERVRIGGGNPEEVLADCGLVTDDTTTDPTDPTATTTTAPPETGG